ncbi:MAG: hypothetical protein D6814_15020 [Calditrichaeota bacterium]|nr:MAG: hypothetical protein D6814_15020 [Calditrichota bacterium]
MRNLFVILVLGCLCISTRALAQSTALPLLSHGNGDFSLSLQGGVVRNTLHQDRNDLYAFIARPALGLRKTLDIYGLVGLVQQRIRYADATLTAFHSGYDLLLGGGVSWKTPVRFPGAFSLMVVSQAQAFFPQGKSHEMLKLKTETLRKIRQTRYTWLQFQGAVFMVKRLAFIDVFAGPEIMRQQVTYQVNISLEQNQSAVPVNRLSGQYDLRTDLQLSAGLNAHLPGAYQLGLQIRGSNANHFAVFIGLSQTGWLD